MPCRMLFEVFGSVDPELGGSELELPGGLLEPLPLVTWAGMATEFVAAFELLALELESSQPASVPTNAHHAACKSVLCKVIATRVY